MNEQTSRRAFLQAGLAAAAVGLLGPRSRAEPAAPDVPSYLKGYEVLYRKNPRAAATQWFREAHFGLFMHYGLYSLLGSTLQEGSWGYNTQKRNITTDEAWAKLSAAGAAHANLLLNTGPLPDGSIAPAHAQVLRGLGQRIRADGFPATATAPAPRRKRK